MPHKSNRVNLNLGSSSLLLIFVVLSLVSFAVLSLSSALSDKSMAQKNLDRNIAYYDACNIAQEKLEVIDNKLYEIYLDSADENEYMSKCFNEIFDAKLYSEADSEGDANIIGISTSDNSISYIIPVSEYQGLQVVIAPTYPVDSDDTLFEIIDWKLVYTAEPNIDFSVNVIK